VGVYPVPEAEEPCHLIDVVVRDASGPIALSDFTQEIPGQPRENWQVPYDDRILDDTGRLLADTFEAERKPDLWTGDVRLIFFFHYLDVDKPLLTPFGPATVPQPTERPEPLRIIQYEAH
jgi:hypothetical protein